MRSFLSCIFEIVSKGIKLEFNQILNVTYCVNLFGNKRSFMSDIIEFLNAFTYVLIHIGSSFKKHTDYTTSTLSMFPLEFFYRERYSGISGNFV